MTLKRPKLPAASLYQSHGHLDSNCSLLLTIVRETFTYLNVDVCTNEQQVQEGGAANHKAARPKVMHRDSTASLETLPQLREQLSLQDTG